MQSKLKFYEIKVLSYSEHPDKKNNVLHHMFRYLIPLNDMNDLAITCSDFVNALKILICSEKHAVSRANYGYAKKW